MARCVRLLFIILLFCNSSLLFAQLGIPVDNLTNRRLGYVNDASAVGWNPSLLGVNMGAFELLLAVPFRTLDSKFSSEYALLGGFAKLGPVGVGIMSPASDSSFLMPTTQYFAGLGVPILEDQLWAGASIQFPKGGKVFGDGEINLSATGRPIEDLLAAISIGNLTGNNNHDPRIDVTSSYRLLNWLTLFGGLQLDNSDTLFGRSAFGTSLGLSLGFSDNQLMISGQHDFKREVTRLGLEIALGGPSGGIIADLGNGDFTGGVALFRYGSEENFGLEEVTPDPELPNPMGWAPDRAYTPIGLEYRRATTDATRDMEALAKGCEPGAGTPFETPTGVYNAVTGGGTPYAPLASRIQRMTTTPSDLYKVIRREIYTAPIRNAELMTGDSLSIVSKQGYAIGVQSTDASRFPQVSVIMQVTDSRDRAVSGLTVDDFTFRDPNTQIISVRPIDSNFNVPADVVMLIDCSGSMGEEIASVLRNAESFANNLATRGIDYRIGLVLYGSVIYDTLHPTSNLTLFKERLANGAAIGGDEITTLAVKAASEMNFRPNARRIFVLVTDDWQVQENARLNESDLVQMLWDTRARMYSIINPCKNNGAITTSLSLGREYNITSPFNSILDEIGTEITTTYQLVYESRKKQEEVIPKVTILRGRVRDETGSPAGVDLTLRPNSGAPIMISTNQTTGEFETEITEGMMYTVTGGDGKYIPLSEQLDLTAVAKGDTIERLFTLRVRPTTLAGRILDEKGTPVEGEVVIEDATTLESIARVKTNSSGEYQTEIAENRLYRLTPAVKGYIPTPTELSTRGVARGTSLSQDLNVMSLDEAIARGATFRLKNIFFDFNKADLKPESLPELDRLVALLNEYSVIKVEVGAHTDSKGSDEYNQTLSGKRAKSVMDYLISKGIAETRLTSKGYGETLPVATNETDEGRALNRRVEFKLVR